MGVGLSWRYLLGTEIGTSHARAGTPCQDEVAVSVERTADGGPVLAMFVCDGAGSASEGGTGAELAVEASLRLLSERSAAGALDFDEQLAQDLISAARNKVEEHALRAGLKPRDYACTYLALLSEDSLGTIVIQLGDGGVVVDLGRGLVCLTQPMNGEYANSTCFLTDVDASTLVQIQCVQARIERAAVFTDGLQSLGVDQATNTPHAPFFRPFFEALESTEMPPDAKHPLQGALTRFLRSDLVNARTDDDKSIALAIWQPNPSHEGIGEVPCL
ncbi:PP2C family serine/threonine-protein phosphatase [Kribbella sp. NPDC050470]|uniref:PP2C family serine/threonine-protein phosphatase n=1 Tax=unclassified Kribbella TaxID=2644121 RepID=UPI00379B3027